MKRLIKSLFVVGTIALAIQITSSCEKDNAIENKLVGKWQSESYRYRYAEYDKSGHQIVDLDVLYGNSAFNVIMELDSDGTGTWIDDTNDYYSVEKGRWYLSDNKIIITMSDLEIDYFDLVSVTSKKLVLCGKEVSDDGGSSTEVELHFKKIL